MICTILSVTSSGKRRNKEEIVDVVMWVEGGGGLEDGRSIREISYDLSFNSS